jgi:hypothetical protein
LKRIDLDYQDVVDSTSSSAAAVVPYTAAASTLQSFLAFFPGLSLPATASEDDLSREMFDCRKSLRFSQLVPIF